MERVSAAFLRGECQRIAFPEAGHYMAWYSPHQISLEGAVICKAALAVEASRRAALAKTFFMLTILKTFVLLEGVRSGVFLGYKRRL